MKLRTQYIVGLVLSTILPVGFTLYHMKRNHSLTKNQTKLVIVTVIAGRTLVITGHARLIGRGINKLKKK